MYIPDDFRLEDQEAIRQILDRYAFAALVTSTDGVPEATHLPLIYEPEAGPRGRLVGHLARANGQSRQLAAAEQAGREMLAIFQGPHAYVSPRDYGAGPPTVPTWNYVAVHVYGVPRLFTDRAEARALVTALTSRHEAGRPNPWSPDSLDPDWVGKMLRGIQAFEIPITRIDAKAKLSQNREADQAGRAADALQAADDPLARETGRLMRDALESCQ
jgi:transcriptional regulator